MHINVDIPTDLEHRSVQARLRFWAEQYSRVRPPNHHMIAALQQAATDLELMQDELTQLRHANPDRISFTLPQRVSHLQYLYSIRYWLALQALALLFLLALRA